MRRGGLCAIASLVVLAIAAPAAEAKTLKLKGSIDGNPAATVKVKVKVKKGNIQKIKGMKFRQVPANCSDGSSGTIGGNLNPFRIRGKDFTRKGPIRGTGIQNGFVRVAGKFARGGKIARGKVRFSFKIDSGAGCGTGDVAWSARK